MSDELLASAWDRIDSRLTIVNWPCEPPPVLAEAIANLVMFETANGPPAVLPGAEDTNVLVWRGYLTGGIAALYEQLSGLVDAHGLIALIGDARLEVHLVARADRVAVLGALRHPVLVDRGEFEAKLAGASGAADLAASFFHDALNQAAGEVLARALERDRAQSHGIGAPPPAALPQVAPGELDFDLLEEATVEVCEVYDPEDDLIEAAIRCETFGGWLTDFLAPGFGNPEGERWEDSFCWRAVQWRWVDRGEDATDDDRPGGWRLRARQELPVDELARWLPPDVVSWLDRMTQRCLDVLEAASSPLELPGSRMRSGAASPRAWLACDLHATEPPVTGGPAGRRAPARPRFVAPRRAVSGLEPDPPLLHTAQKLLHRFRPRNKKASVWRLFV